ncbi:FCD domain-containing protein [Nitratireductor sp. CH_MIT9313-5]|uniref:FCD domain-containing protein n=1 Tax=Nitratireductor sp. CH_MIT9313-5 TaxID=3107764 RepID=UPI003008DDB6
MELHAVKLKPGGPQTALTMLADCSNNLFIKRAVEHQNHLRRLNELALFSSLTFERMRESCDEHLQILDAVENADNQRAAGLMRSHLSRADSTYSGSYPAASK